MITGRRMLAPVLACLLAACASDVDVGASHDPLARFPAQATFMWDERANSLPDDERIRSLDFDTLLREVVGAELARKGYRESTSGSLQYWLSYQASLNTRVRPEETVSVGSVSLLLVEAASKRRVWVGFVRAEIDASLSREQRRERLREAVRRMFEDFPP